MKKNKFFVMTSYFGGGLSYSWMKAKDIEEAYEILDSSSKSNSVTEWVLTPEELKELKEVLISEDTFEKN